MLQMSAIYPQHYKEVCCSDYAVCPDNTCGTSTYKFFDMLSANEDAMKADVTAGPDMFRNGAYRLFQSSYFQVADNNIRVPNCVVNAVHQAY